MEAEIVSATVETFEEINKNVKNVSDLVDRLFERVQNNELTTESGLSFLEIKYQSLLSYLINLTYIVLRKCSAESIEAEAALDRLIEMKVVIEKIRPIDYKLRYQIGKLIKTAVTGESSNNDLTSFKADPKSLVSSLAADSESSDDDSEDGKSRKRVKKSKSSSSNLYVPPKLTAVQYDGDETIEKRQQNRLDRARKLALNSSIIQDLKEEYLDTPLEITSSSQAQKMHSRAQREKEEYEEQYLTRLPITKLEKRKQRNLSTMGKLGKEITSFGDITVLETNDLGADRDGPATGKKRKLSKKLKKKFGNKKRKIH